jgi:hypothetical protein
VQSAASAPTPTWRLVIERKQPGRVFVATMRWAERSPEILVRHQARMIGLPVRLDPAPATAFEHQGTLRALTHSADRDPLATGGTVEWSSRAVLLTERSPERLVRHDIGVSSAPMQIDAIPAGAAKDIAAFGTTRLAALRVAVQAGDTGTRRGRHGSAPGMTRVHYYHFARCAARQAPYASGELCSLGARHASRRSSVSFGSGGSGGGSPPRHSGARIHFGRRV